MYKLKDKYKDSRVSKNGSSFRLSWVRQDQVETLGLEKYFDKKEVAMKENKKRTNKK